MRKISITEYDDKTVIRFKPEFVQYEFDAFDDAMEALQNLEEVHTNKDNKK